MSAFWMAAVIAVWLVVALLALVVLGLLRQIAPILERADAVLAGQPTHPGLPVGSPIPTFALTAADGSTLTDTSLVGTPFTLLFVSSGCEPCRRLAAALREDDVDLPVELIVVADELDLLSQLGEWPTATLTSQSAHQVSEAFRTGATPHAFAIDRGGTIAAAGFPNTAQRLMSLIEPTLEGGDAQVATPRTAVSIAS
jgi:AhpC/TSA family